MDSKRFWIILAAIMLGFLGFIFFTKEKLSNSNNSPSSTQGSSNYYGKMDSPVTITEFIDFQCEACYAYYPAVKQVKEQYKDKVRFQIRYFPIEGGDHLFSRQSARSAEAAALQGMFWEMHDKLLEGQKIWERTSDPQPYYDQYAKEIGLDMAKFEQDRKSKATNDVINNDLKAVRELGLTGTPSFVINGKKVESPNGTIEGLSKMIDTAIEEANVVTNE